jgi:methylmalonyl-CoA mutase N-terminal domain/subunit
MGKKGLKDIRGGFRKWEKETLDETLKNSQERKPAFKSTSGYDIERVYMPFHTIPDAYIEDVGYPGKYPFTRGIQPTMYRGRYWTMRQYAGFGTAEESNVRYRYLLEQGQTGLSVAFDLPTQMGYDSDHPMARGEVGKVGVAIDSLEDMETLFREIPLGRVSTSMTINATASIILAMYIAVGKKNGVSMRKMSGTIQNDILKEYIARGTYIFPPGPSMRIITDIFEFCSKDVPRWNTISISGYHIREAGSTAVQEVAFTLADGIAYVEAAVNAGLEVDSFSSRLSFFFNAHNNFLEEVAKFRAARRLWARIMKERFRAKNPRSMMLRFHTQTAGSSLTAQQPENNIVRVAIQALASVFGGTQSLHTNSMDEALSLPTEDAVRVALRTQQVLAHESGVADTVDALSGSYAIEAMTDKIEEEAEAYIKKIEKNGGMIKAIESGYVQKEIQESSYQYQLAVEKKEAIVVGVNEYVMQQEPPKNLLKVDPKIEKMQRKKIRELKKRRDKKKVTGALESLKEACQTGNNVMYPILEAVECYGTIGEISDVMRSVFGTYTARSVL